MSQELSHVAIVGTGSFLPGKPIPNSQLDELLGAVDGAPDRVQKFIDTVAKRMLESSGVETRHFAIDPETHDLTHTVSSLAEEAARRAIEAAGKKPEDIELLILSSPTYDCSTPPTSTLLQERLGIETCAEMEVHSNCAGVGKEMQIGYDALRLGRYKTALIVYSQLSSVYVRNSYFNQPLMTKAQATLRYILADGAGAVVLEGFDGKGDPPPHQVLGTYVESVGGKMKAAMTAGGGVLDLIKYDQQIPSMWERGLHHLDQDFAAVNRFAGPKLFEGVKRMVELLGMKPHDVDAVVASIPTHQLYKAYVDKFVEYFDIDEDAARFRGGKTGYCGGASILLHFDEMVRTGEAKPGDVIVVHSVESSKWMTAGFIVKW